MKRFHAFLLLAFCTTLACSGCGDKKKDAIPSVEPSTVVESPLPSEMPNEIPSEIVEKTFALTEEEQKIYNEYVLDINNKEILKDLSPKVIAKLYVQAGIDKNIEAEYNLYEPSSVGLTLEDYKKAMEESSMILQDNNIMQSIADVIFSTIDEAEFVEDSPTTGHIKLLSIMDEGMSVRFIKDADGIWRLQSPVPSIDSEASALPTATE